MSSYAWNPHHWLWWLILYTAHVNTQNKRKTCGPLSFKWLDPSPYHTYHTYHTYKKIHINIYIHYIGWCLKISTSRLHQRSWQCHVPWPSASPRPQPPTAAGSGACNLRFEERGNNGLQIAKTGGKLEKIWFFIEFLTAKTARSNIWICQTRSTFSKALLTAMIICTKGDSQTQL